MHSRLFLTIGASAAVLAAGCRAGLPGPDHAGRPATAAAAAGYVTLTTPGGMEYGTLRVERAQGGGVRVVGLLAGVPAGPHGVHVHAVGRCEPPAFTSAGGHFNPHDRQHGLRSATGPHAGDAPNIVANAAGHAPVDLLFPFASVDSGAVGSLWDPDGSALVVHASADDQVSDPAGDAGNRIACGVIRPASLP